MKRGEGAISSKKRVNTLFFKNAERVLKKSCYFSLFSLKNSFSFWMEDFGFAFFSSPPFSEGLPKNLDLRIFRRLFDKFYVFHFEKDTIHSEVEGIKLSFFYYPYALLKPLRRFDIIKIASLECTVYRITRVM